MSKTRGRGVRYELRVKDKLHPWDETEYTLLGPMKGAKKRKRHLEGRKHNEQRE